MASVKEIECKECGGTMKIKRKAKHNQLLAIVVLGIAVVISFTGIGLIVGIPLGLYGLYMAAATEKYWLCKTCRAVVQRG